ncbi:MAG: restriction endonuclease subunit R, partial [Candidatus Sumerlaeota bacterium]|nr:restriction endonuclease subunit R [Candidatus Sumerlaeota bacterium]
AARTILPVFVVRSDGSWRPVNYEMDISAWIPWEKAALYPVMQLTLPAYEEKDVEMGLSLTDSGHGLVEVRNTKDLKEGGIQVDKVFMTRQLLEVVSNPWQAHEFAARILDHFRNLSGDKQEVERQLTNNFVFLIEETRKQLELEKDRLAEALFRAMLEKDELRFLFIGNNFDWSFPKKIALKKDALILTKKTGHPLQLSLFEQVPEDQFNETEKTVAWYLEDQERLFFWYRNRSRLDYAIQGWRQHRIYPDFIFTATGKETQRDYDRVYVVETKGLHLKGASRTDYTQKVFDICTRQAKSRNLGEFGLEMKDKVLRFELLAEDEWRAKLNAILSE